MSGIAMRNDDQRSPLIVTRPVQTFRPLEQHFSLTKFDLGDTQTGSIVDSLERLQIISCGPVMTDIVGVSFPL